MERDIYCRRSITSVVELSCRGLVGVSGRYPRSTGGTVVTAASQIVRSNAGSPSENFQQWRAGLASLFEAAPLDGTVETFRADLHCLNLGSFLIGMSKASPQAFCRDRNLVSAVGVDHLLIQLYVSGECEFKVDGSQSRGAAGDIVCFDLSRQMSSQTGFLETVSLVVPRHLVRLSPRAFDALHGAVLGGDTTLGVLLREHLLSMAKVAPRLGAQDGKLVTEAAAALISAGLSRAISGSATPESELIGSGLHSIQGFIERNLTDEALSPEMIMRHFGLSRSVLYRIFEPLGGIADYIRDRRLDRAFLQLASVGKGRGGVSRLAYANGFASEAAFSRAFRQRFGMNPSEAILELDRRVTAKNHVQDNWLQAWLHGLSHTGLR
jgi:AraC-like DNA-binding protein